jgi:hypothetical protein
MTKMKMRLWDGRTKDNLVDAKLLEAHGLEKP